MTYVLINKETFIVENIIEVEDVEFLEIFENDFIIINNSEREIEDKAHMDDLYDFENDVFIHEEIEVIEIDEDEST